MRLLFCRRQPSAFLFTLFLLIVSAQLTFAADAALNVTISGVAGELQRNVEAALVVPAGLVKEGQVNQLWLRRYVRQIPQKVRQALEPLGYYNARVKTDLQEGVTGKYLLTVTIAAGPPTYVENIDLTLLGEGTSEPLLMERLERFPLRQGDILRHDRYEQGKRELENIAIDLGYIKTHYTTHKVLVNVDRNRASLSLFLDTGPKFYFGPTSFPAAPQYPERFLRRYLAFRTGAVFSYAALGKTQTQFLDSDRFQNVTISAQIDSAEENHIPIEIRLQPRPRRTLRPGIGYGTDTGPRFSLLYEDINTWKLAHKFEADLVIAEMRQSINLSYIVPSYSNINSYTVFKSGLNREETDTYTSRKIFAETEIVHSRGRGKTLSFYLRLQREDYEIGNTDDASQLLIPGIRWNRRTYSSPTRPDKGFHLGLEVRGTREDFLSDISLLQVIGEANMLIPLSGRYSLFLRGNGATTLQDDEFQSIPVSMRFFAGGDHSVRGYGYQSLGPVDSTNEVVGGKHLLVGSIEIERALGDNWGLAVFHDSGNAFNNLSDYELARSAGIGLRWYTLVGPIKVDVARQLDEADPSYRLHFSMGFTW